MKIEELLFGTRSRNAGKMASYYAHWEAQLYCAVITMVLRNLDVYIHLLDGRQVRPSNFPFRIKCEQSLKPWFVKYEQLKNNTTFIKGCKVKRQGRVVLSQKLQLLIHVYPSN